MKLVFLLLNIFVINTFPIKETTGTRKPIILIPGLGGSELSLQNSNDAEPYPVWVNIYLLFQPKKLISYLLLKYNKLTGKMINNNNYIISPPKFGSVEGIDYLSKHLHSETVYYGYIIKALESIGYKTDIDLFGAAYDFRYIPEMETTNKFFASLQNLIEETSKKQKSKIIIVSHSMGSPMMQLFLTKQTQQWKDDHIDYWYSINGAFGGSFKSVESITSGTTPNLPRILDNPRLFKEMQRSFYSTYYMLPTKYIFSSTPLVQTPFDTFYLHNISLLYKLLNVSNYKFFLQQRSDPWTYEKSGVNMVCSYSRGIQTQFTVKLDAGLNLESDQIYDDGDETVSIKSQSLCGELKDKSKQLKTVIFEKINHIDVLKNDHSVETFLNMIKEINSIP